MTYFMFLSMILASPQLPDAQSARPAALPGTDAAGGIASRQLASLFQSNLGQFHDEVRFAVVRAESRVEARDSALRIIKRERDSASSFTLEFGSASIPRSPEATDPAVTRVNYFLGNDPAEWHVDVPTWRRVHWNGVAPGISVDAFVAASGVEYDLRIDDTANLEAFRITCPEAIALRLAEDGSLEVETRSTTYRQSPPRAFWFDALGTRRESVCRMVVDPPNRFGFLLDASPPSGRWLIDPVLGWSTFYGGSTAEQAKTAGIDAEGNVYLAGSTNSFDIETTPGAFDSTNNYIPGANGTSKEDGFIAKLDRTGSQLVYATYFGGQRYDDISSSIVYPDGSLLIVGETTSHDLPTTPAAYDTTIGKPYPQLDMDAFVARLAPSGNALQYSTYFGGSDTEQRIDCNRSVEGHVLVSGATRSFNLPVSPSAPDTTYTDVFPTSEGDGFAAVFNEDCSNLLFATYIGGIHDDVVYAIASDSDGNLIVAGTTFSPDFPVTLGAFDSSLGVSGSGFDGFVTRIDLQNNVFSSSSYLGGNDHDTPRDIAIAKNGDAIVVGNSYSDDFPIVGTVQDRCGWFCDLGFVTRITPDATKLVYSVWYGGASSSVPEEVRVLADDSVVFAGFTQNPNWPVTPGAFQADINQGVPNSWWDAFITHISADARRIFYSTFFGGEERDWGLGLAIDRDGSAILAGYTIPINFPTTPGTYQTSPTIPHITNAETFAARLSLLPAGLDRYGAPTATCSDDPLQIFAYSMPAVRNLDFCLRCIGADPAAPGVMLLGPKSLPAGPLNSGIRIWVEAQQAKIMLLSADAHGAAEVALPIPGIPSLAGLVGYTQFIFHDDCAPGALTASGGLAITIQP